MSKLFLSVKVKAKMLGQNKKEDIVKEDTPKDDIANELYLKEPDDIQKTLGDGFGLEEEKIEEPIDDMEERESDAEKVEDDDLPDDEFFDAHPIKTGKSWDVGQDSPKDLEEENPDEVIGDFFDKPMMAQKAQMKVKRKLAKLKKIH